MTFPHDIESLAWHLHDHPQIIMVANNENRRLLKYDGIKNGSMNFIAQNGFNMKFGTEGAYCTPIEFKEDHFVRHITPCMVCQYFYASEQDVKECEWDQLLLGVQSHHF